MASLKQFTFESPKLLVFGLGGKALGCNIEVHDFVFIVAKTDQEATEKIRKKWYGTQKSLHVDSWLAVELIDGYQVTLSKEPNLETAKHIYFVNLGYYRADFLGEHHFMTLVVADSKRDATQKAMDKCPHHMMEMLHIDDVHDLDGCIRLDEVDQYFIDLTYTGSESIFNPINGYQNLLS